MLSIFRRLMKNEHGATAIEYTLIASLIAVAAIAAFTTVGTKVSSRDEQRRRQHGLIETVFGPGMGGPATDRPFLLSAMLHGLPTLHAGRCPDRPSR